METFWINAFLFLIVLWTIVWKVYAAWIAARHSQKKWFVALIVLNTAGLLEIFYIFRIAKKKWVEVKNDFRHALGSIK